MKPIRLVVTRSPDSASPQFGFASIKLSVLYARRVVIEVFDLERDVAAHHVVRSSVPSSSSSSCSSSSSSSNCGCCCCGGGCCCTPTCRVKVLYSFTLSVIGVGPGNAGGLRSDARDSGSGNSRRSCCSCSCSSFSRKRSNSSRQ